MGKTGKWIKSLLTGKKAEKEKNCTIQEATASLVGAENPTTPIIIFNCPTTPKEKKRWSFRRSSATSGPLNFNSMEVPPILDSAKAQSTTTSEASAQARSNPYEQAAAIMIQSTFRSYLARKALRALRALVKLQALVRGYLVRKQAKATLRCMQALLTVQARVRAQRIQKPVDRRAPHDLYNDAERSLDDENIKIVEMDIGGSTKSSRKSYSTTCCQAEHRFSSYHPPYSKLNEFMTEMSPSGHFVDYYSMNTAQSNPQYHSEMSQVPFACHQAEYAESLNYESSLFPNYMANTQSSRAKARSQSAPKCRPESYRRRPSIEGRNVPRVMRMQRSSSQVGAAIQGYNYPWSIKLDQSNASLKASECGSTSTILTANTY